jgi:hypothetical protein
MRWSTVALTKYGTPGAKSKLDPSVKIVPRLDAGEDLFRGGMAVPGDLRARLDLLRAARHLLALLHGPQSARVVLCTQMNASSTQSGAAGCSSKSASGCLWRGASSSDEWRLAG